MTVLLAMEFEIRGMFIFSTVFLLIRCILSPFAELLGRASLARIILLNIGVLVGLCVLMLVHVFYVTQNSGATPIGAQHYLRYYKTRLGIDILIFLICGFLWDHFHPRRHGLYRDLDSNFTHDTPGIVTVLYDMIISTMSTISLIRIIMTCVEHKVFQL